MSACGSMEAAAAAGDQREVASGGIKADWLAECSHFQAQRMQCAIIQCSCSRHGNSSRCRAACLPVLRGVLSPGDCVAQAIVVGADSIQAGLQKDCQQSEHAASQPASQPARQAHHMPPPGRARKASTSLQTWLLACHCAANRLDIRQHTSANALACMRSSPASASPSSRSTLSCRAAKGRPAPCLAETWHA